MPSHSARSLYTCLDTALIRLPVLPRDHIRRTRPGINADDMTDDAAAMRRRLADLVADPVVREAIAVSSRALAEQVDEALAGREIPPNRLGDLVNAVTRYLLRMATRPTPFGLMAGVAPARFGDDATAWLGTRHRKSARPDMGWLLSLVNRWECLPEVWRHLDIVANDLCVRRGDRIVLPLPPFADGTDHTAPMAAEVSVRHTPVVKAALRMAAVRIPGDRLTAALERLFPHAAPGAVPRLIGQLVAKEILLTSLRPPADTPDPLAHVLERLRHAEDLPERDVLAAIHRDLRAYAAAEPGAGLPKWNALTATMRSLAPRDQVVQVDLAMDAHVTLPQCVAEEAERAASALTRMATGPDAPEYLRRYHLDFLERYGAGRLVPIKDLLDPAVGLGTPAGYQVPPGAGPAALAREQARDNDRDRLLAALVMDAVRRRAREIVLDDATVAALSPGPPKPLPSLELYGTVVAGSMREMAAGNFRLWLTSDTGSGQAGATAGRFARLLGEETAVLAVAATDPGRLPPGALAAQLSYRGAFARTANLTQVPQWLGHRISVGEFADPADPRTIGIDDLAVGADETRLYLASISKGREIAPICFFMANSRTQAPNLARFIQEIAWSGTGPWTAWDWGALSSLPFTPRVRHGRTVLAEARWSLDAASLPDARAPEKDWRRGFDQWRDDWAVPDAVRLSSGGREIELDLSSPAHTLLLREEIIKRPDSILREVPDDGTLPSGRRTGDGVSPSGWLIGPGGAHVNEVVFALTSPTRHKRAAGFAVRRPGTGDHLPGGQWLYAKVYGAERDHDHILGERIPALLAGLEGNVTRWFFIRYRDPEPHLRLRFRCAPGVQSGELLPVLAAWLNELREARLARGLAIDTYDPELERYGGTEAMAAAEAVFCADSSVVIAQLRARNAGRLTLDRRSLAALNYLDIVRAFHPKGEGAEPLLGLYPRGEFHDRTRRERDALTRLVTAHGPEDLLSALPVGDALATAWHARAEALRRYAEELGGSEAESTPDDVLASLLHMHHNRLAGIDRAGERISLAIARGAAEAYHSRLRALR
ncbi:hypothetical protein Sme01_19380 [Sphaerisporangium melleum]|uniref:Lantibiotic dehydratase n=1 Tax=Sphaerisporangium melleum TaxID=321316 RepID=A0A917REX1_9ACTN|nr:lantibiotic dehydratase [Sphaerisporangium melleum]GGL02920.1 hypothetical protein GCM10007964_51260 [Sphaerisporangium melleum]GII69462.1 hypothetical protein Sme01_19380 [Sphaerisporangium melleum]